MAMGASSTEAANEQLVREAMVQIQHSAGLGCGCIPCLSPAFTLRSNSILYDCQSFLAMWRDRREMLQEVRFTFEHVCARGDRVAVLRDTSVTLKDGTHQPGIAVFDVWRVQGGQIVSGEQCWQRLRGPAGDDIPHTPREGELAELVHKALAGLQNLAAVQAHLRKHWAPDFNGSINGRQLDLAALCAHWMALQAELTTLIIDVKEAVVHNNCVAVRYHALAGRTNRQAAELQALAIFRLDPASGCIVGSDAVVRLLSGAPDDEGLATLKLS